MKTIAICSLFVLSALVVGMVATPPTTFADHAEVRIMPVLGSAEGCNKTPEGCFTPHTATVDVGGKVIFDNTNGDEKHLFISGILIAATDEFQSSIVNPGSLFEWTPTEAGEVSYFCGLHPWETGTIIVQEASAITDDEVDGKMRMEGDPSVTGMLSDGTMVKIWADALAAGEMMEIFIEFAKMDGKTGVEHVNYDIVVTQNGVNVLDDLGAHSHDGKYTHTTAALASADPVDITVTFNGFGLPDAEEFTGPVGEEVTFMNVVPEFGTIAMMVLAVAIVSIVAVTAKSRVVPRL